MDTEHLIDELSRRVEPVRPLNRPWRRTGAWALIAAVYLLVLIVIMSPRQDLGARMQDPRFLIEQMAALLTGLTAAAAAFATVVPGYRRSVMLLPVGPLLVWVGAVAAGALEEYMQVGGGVLGWQLDWACVGTILAGAAVPAVTMQVMLQQGAPITPRRSAALGGLAAAGMGNLGVCLFHPHSSNLILLFWHCGTVLILAALAGVAGRRLLRWPPRHRLILSS
jgi:hypothetical protein